MTAPVPVAARLRYTRRQAEDLAKPRRTTTEVRPLLRQYHDDLMTTLVPRLAQMRTEGLVIDHASSWLLGEFVAHVDPDRVEEAEERLKACPELTNVGRAAKPGKRRRR